MMTSLSEWLVGTCRRNICPTAKKASITNVVNGGRTWARTKDPLIKRQQFSQCFQRRFRQIHDIPPVALPREAVICRNAGGAILKAHSDPQLSQLHSANWAAQW